MKKNRHIRLLWISLAAAALTSLYVQIAQYGQLRFGLAAAGQTLLLAAVLFGALEGGLALCGKRTGRKRFGPKEAFAVLCCVILAVLAFLPAILDFAHEAYPYYSAPQEKLGVGRDGESRPVILTGEATLSQSFRCPEGGFHVIYISCAFGQDRDSTLNWMISDFDAKEILESGTLELGSLPDGGSIRLEPETEAIRGGLDGKILYLRLFSEDATSRNALTVYTSPADRTEGLLTVNGEEEEGDLCFSLLGMTKPVNYEGVRIWMCVYTAILACIAAGLLIRKYGDRLFPDEGEGR